MLTDPTSPKLTPKFKIDFACQNCGKEISHNLGHFDSIPECDNCGGELLVVQIHDESPINKEE